MKAKTTPRKYNRRSNTEVPASERKLAQNLQKAIDGKGFVPLAEAARQLDIPLSTLAHAVKQGRVPAVQVQPRRWLVRLQAAQCATVTSKLAHADAIHQRLVQAGVVLPRKGKRKSFRKFEPLYLPGKPLSQQVIEDRG